MQQCLVIIPVFNARSHVQACLESVARCSPAARVLVIDDASTDPQVRPLLERWASASPQRECIVQDSNRGFVATVNHGLRCTEGNVVILNSDTLVTPGWLERLERCLDADPEIATATPWTNNGEIASFPDLCTATEVPADPDELARLIAASGAPEYPEIPTAVGFCMAISRAAINRVGYLDEESFGRGYGEENDFCMRAAAAGMRNVLCDDAYVAHHGGASFTPLGLKPDQGSMQRLLRKHPGYERTISQFISADPLAPRRARISEYVRAARPGALESSRAAEKA